MNHKTALIYSIFACFTVASSGQSVIPILEGQTLQTLNFHGTAPDVTLPIGPEDTVVGPGVELTSFGWSGFVNIDFSDTHILITAATDQPFGYFETLRFSDVNGTIPDFSSVSLNPSTDWAGFQASGVSLVNPDVIDVNLTALNGLQGQTISMDITAVPEPVSTIIVGLMLLGVAARAAFRGSRV